MLTWQTLYDMASLTKVTTCTTAAMQLYQRGLIGLDDHVSDERYLGRQLLLQHQRVVYVVWCWSFLVGFCSLSIDLNHIL